MAKPRGAYVETIRSFKVLRLFGVLKWVSSFEAAFETRALTLGAFASSAFSRFLLNCDPRPKVGNSLVI